MLCFQILQRYASLRYLSYFFFALVTGVVFFYFLFTRTFMSNEWALFWMRFILPDVVNYNRPSIAIISQM